MKYSETIDGPYGGIIVAQPVLRVYDPVVPFGNHDKKPHEHLPVGNYDKTAI